MNRLKFAWIAGVILTLTMHGHVSAADRDGDGFSDDAEVSEGSDPDDPDDRPIGFVASSPWVNVLSFGDEGEVTEGSGCIATPQVSILRMSGDGGDVGAGTFAALPQINVLRMSGGIGSGGGSIIGRPPVFVKRSDADFDAGLEPFLAYDRASSMGWHIETVAGQSGAVIDNSGGDVPADDWLISPSKALEAGERMVVNFDYFQQGSDPGISQGAFGSASSLRVLVSSNYSGGDPLAATWLDVTPAGLDGLTEGVWHSSRESIVDGVSGANVRIAFRYLSSGAAAGQAKKIGIDNVYILEDLFQPPPILAFEADGVEITDGLHIVSEPVLSVTATALHRAGKAQFLYRLLGASDYSLIGEDVDFSDGASILWTLAGLADGDYQLAVRLWSGPNYTVRVNAVRVLYSDTTGPILTDWRWDNTVLGNGLVVGGSGVVRVDANDPAGVSRVDFYTRSISDTVEKLFGSDANPADGYSAWWDAEQTTEDGDYLIIAKAYDSLGNQSSESRTFNLVLARPPPPVVTGPANGLVTSQPNVTLTGIGLPDSVVAIYQTGGVTPFLVTTRADGSFSRTLTLREGSNLLEAANRNRGGESERTGVSVSLDSSTPGVPPNLTASSQAGGVVRLMWSRPSGSVSGYHVYRSLAPFEAKSEAVQLTSTAFGGTIYDDTPADDGRYYYAVSTVNAAGSEGPLSKIVSATRDTIAPDVLAVTYTAIGKFDPASGRFGVGSVEVSVMLSEPVQASPFFSITPSGGSPLIVSLQKVDPTKYRGSFTIGAGTPSGSAMATVAMRDLAGNRGSTILSGDSILIDTNAPNITALEVLPGFVIKNDPTTPVSVTIRATFDSKPKAGTVPEFSYTLSSSVPTPTAIPGFEVDENDPLVWVGSFTLPPTAGQTTEKLELFFTATDDLDNIGGSILADHELEVYQGDLPGLDSPIGLIAKGMPGGEVALEWQSVEGAADYEIYRKSSSETQFTIVGTSGSQLSYRDLPAADGTYEYAVGAVRMYEDLTSVGDWSNTALALSDRVPPAAPSNLRLQLLGLGVQATWLPHSGLLPTDRFVLYREDSSGADRVVALSDIDKLTATDSSPALSHLYYLVSARDSVGNESAPSTRVYLNASLLPVNGLSVVYPVGDYPTIGWTGSSGVNAGYSVFQGIAPQQTKLNGGNLVPGTSYLDTGYNSQGDRVYTVAAVDQNGVESPGRTITLPRLSVTPTPGNVIRRGEMSRLFCDVRNDSGMPIGNVRARWQIPGGTYFSDGFSIQPGETKSIAVVVPGNLAPGVSSVAATLELEIAPNPGESVLIRRFEQVAVGAGGLKLDLIPGDFQVGGTGMASFRLLNTSTEPIDLITATGRGSQDSPEIRFIVFDAQDNVVAVKAFKATAGPEVLSLGNGNSIVRLPPGYEYTPVDTLIDIPAGISRNLQLKLEIDNIRYRHGEGGEISLGRMVARTDVLAGETSYFGRITSVSPEVSFGDQDIVITGQAVLRSDQQPKPNARLVLTIGKGGFEARYDVITDENGSFSYSFRPPRGGSGGNYTVRANHPDTTDKRAQSGFTIQKLLVTPRSGTLRAAWNQAQPISVTATTSEGLVLNNLRLAFVAEDQPGGTLPNGVSFLPTAQVDRLEQNASGILRGEFLATSSAPRTGTMVLRVVSDDSGPAGWEKVTVNFEFGEGSALLRATPGHVTTGVSPGSQVSEVVKFDNVGLAAARDLSFRLLNLDGSPAQDWMTLASAFDGDLSIGASVTLEVVAQPDAGVQENDYFFILRGTSSNIADFDVSIHVAVSSSGIGGVAFKVRDPFSGTVNSNGDLIEGVEGASIVLQNEKVLSIQRSLVTDSRGEVQIDDLPAGSYQFRVNAEKHVTASGRLWIRPGITLEKEIALQYSPVSVQWEVVPVTIKDHYNLVLHTTFEADVPVPVLVADPAVINLPRMVKGEVIYSTIKITNHGLIRADNLKVGLPYEDDRFRIDVDTDEPIPESLAAGETLVIPYAMTALKNFGRSEPKRMDQITPSRNPGVPGEDDEDDPEDPEEEGLECIDYMNLIPVTFSFECLNGLDFSATLMLPFYGSYGGCNENPKETVDWSGGGGSSVGTGGSGNSGTSSGNGGGGSGGVGSWGLPGVGDGGGGGGGGGDPPGSPYSPLEKPDPQCYPPDVKYGSPLFTFGWPRDFLTDVGCSVNTMNRQFEDDLVDMSVSIPGHRSSVLTVGRQYRDGRWLHFPTLKFVLDETTNYQTYLELEWQEFRFFQSDYERKTFRSGTSEFVVDYENENSHAKLTFVDGSWMVFDKGGNLRSAGRNNVTHYVAGYDAEGRRLWVDSGGSRLLTYSWNGEHLSAVEDHEGRRVEYNYVLDLLVSVTDPEGAVTGYGYDSYHRINSINDATGKSHSITYRNNEFDLSALEDEEEIHDAIDREVLSVLDQSGRGEYFDFVYDASTEERYGAVTSTEGVVDEKWFYPDGQLKEWKRNGITVKSQKKIVNETAEPSNEYYHFFFIGCYFNGRGTSCILIWISVPYPDAIWRAQTLEITDGDGNTWVEDYDALGLLKTVTNPDGTKKEFEYHPDSHLLAKSTDENLTVSEFEYDARRNLTTTHEAVGTPLERRIERSYDAKDRPLTVTWKGAGVVADKTLRYEYDAGGELTKIVNPLGQQHQILTRSVGGNVLTQRDAKGEEWKFSYDQRHRVDATTDPEDRVTRFEFDAFNNVTGITAPSLRKVTMDYDINNSLVKTTDAAGNASRNEYDADGRLAKSIDASGKMVFYEYDSLGRTAVVRDAVGNETVYHYDPEKAESVPVSITFPTFTRSFQYNERKQVTESVDTLPGGETITTRYTYSATGALMSMVDGEGRSTVYQRDAFDRTVSITRDGSGTSRFAYDVHDNVVAFTNPNGKVWRYRYDAAGQLKEEETPLGKITAFDYDEVGNLVTITRPDGSKVKRTFDSQHRVLTVKQFAVGATTPHKSVSYTHDDDGRITGYSDGVTSGTYAYDDAGRMISETVDYGAFSTTNAYTYHANGSLASHTSPTGTVSSYTYDAANRPLGMSVEGVGEFSVNGYLVNAVTRMTLPGGTTQNFTRDALFRPTRIQSADHRGTGLLDLNLGYSPLGNVTRRDDGSGERILEYDEARRLTQGLSSNYTYDNNGNRLTDLAAGPGTWQYDDDDRLLDDGRNSYVYDANGALITKTPPTGVWNYSYDEEGRLIGVTHGADAISYYYAPDGRRLSKTVNGVTTYFTYSALGLCSEYGAGGTPIREYGYSPVAGGGAAPAYVKTSTGLYFCHSDQIGAPLLLTDASGNVVWAAVYDDFGRATISVNTVENNFRFPGQYFDAESGLHFNQNRYYDPENGRYLSKDPVRDGDNFYAYAGSNPFAFTDPDGLRAVQGGLDWLIEKNSQMYDWMAVHGINPMRTGMELVLGYNPYTGESVSQEEAYLNAWLDIGAPGLGKALGFGLRGLGFAKYSGRLGEDVLMIQEGAIQLKNSSARNLLRSRGATKAQAREIVASFDGQIYATQGRMGEAFTITESSFGSASGLYVTRGSAGATPAMRTKNLALPSSNKALVESSVYLNRPQILLEGRVGSQVGRPGFGSTATGGEWQVITDAFNGGLRR